MTAVTAGARLGRYRLQRPVGRGGEGEVFLALDTRERRQVAVKVVHKGLSEQAALRARQEATVLASLNHPNIVQVFAVGHQDHTWYVAMEWIDGGSMADRVNRLGPLDEQESLRLMADAASALKAAHRLGVLHCDVNPKNMLFDTASSSLRLVDFGLSVLPKTSSSPNRLVGTRQYIAPEVWEGAGVSPKVDVYALGLTLYFFRTGKHAIRGRDLASCRAAHRAGEVEDTERLELDDGLGLRRTTALRPEDRPTMHELSVALGQLGAVQTPNVAAGGMRLRANSMPRHPSRH